MITLAIVIIIGVISYHAFNNQKYITDFKHYPYLEAQSKQFYRWLTAGFIHANWLHLLLNAFVLYNFGGPVEEEYGQFFGPVFSKVLFLLLFLVSVIGANALTYIQQKNNPSFASLGASAGVSGVLFAYVLFFPWQSIKLYGVLPIPGIVAAIAYLAYSYYAAEKQRDLIDHAAHFYGALIGFFFTIAINPPLVWNHFVSRLLNF